MAPLSENPKCTCSFCTNRREINRLREAIRHIGSAWRGGDDAEIATAIGVATDAAGFSEQEGG